MDNLHHVLRSILGDEGEVGSPERVPRISGPPRPHRPPRRETPARAQGEARSARERTKRRGSRALRLPSPLRGGSARSAGVGVMQWSPFGLHPQPLPARGRGAHRVCCTAAPSHRAARREGSRMLAPHEQLALQVFRPRTRIEEDGTVEGYASLFGEIDAARDMVMPGAFARTLKSRGIRRIPMLFQHDPAEPIGVWLELYEDIARAACARTAHSRCGAGARAHRAGARRRGRRAFDRLPHREGARRSGEPRAQADRRRPVGDFHRHLPAARGSARPRQELGLLPAEPRAGARRAGVDEGGGGDRLNRRAGKGAQRRARRALYGGHASLCPPYNYPRAFACPPSIPPRSRHAANNGRVPTHTASPRRARPRQRCPAGSTLRQRACG